MYKPFASPFGRYTFWLGLPLLLIAAGPLMESPFALVDRLGHFPLQVTVMSLPLALVAFLRRKRPGAGWSLVVALGAFFLNGAWLLPYLPVAAERALDGKNALKVVQLNVLRVNKSTKAVTDWVRKENPDVLVVQEIDSEWRTALADIQDLFKHRVLVERRDDFGIAVYSKHRVLSRRTAVLPFINVPALFLVLDFKGVSVRLATMHAPPPVGDAQIAARRGALDKIESWVKQDPKSPAIVAADLNITPYTAVWRRFINVSGLVDPRRGRGFLTTWPAFAPDPFRIPIDHILHNEAFRMVSLKTGEWLGSDHLALVAVLELYNK
jgi:endonuclease/exonuclease/phosphatase (EEP) superfamily protein YafD